MQNLSASSIMSFSKSSRQYKSGDKFPEHAKGASSAVASVLHTKGTEGSMTFTKAGSLIYHANASDFHEWEFRTRLKIAATDESDRHEYAKTMSKIIEGLRGDAFVVAKQIGLKALCEVGDDFAPSGADLLIKKVREVVFPLTTHEAKELFRQYTKPSGSLARQTGESM